MNAAKFVIDADALHAFADGQLGETETAAVERYLADHPDAAAEVAAWRRQNEALAALFPPLGEQVTPERLRPVVIAEGLQRGRSQMLRNVAAALVLVAAAGSLGLCSGQAPQRAPGFLIVDFPRKAVRVADLTLAFASGLAVAVLWPGAKMGMRHRNRHGVGSRARRLYG